MCAVFLLLMSLVSQAPSQPASTPAGQERKPLETSSYFAFADREYIFTIEMIKPGLPILNFISMSEEERPLLASDVRFLIQDRRVPGRLFQVDTSDPKQPVLMPSIRIHPRSSFGVVIKGEFGDAKESSSVTIRIGSELFRLVPLTSFDFENLVLKVGRINLESPDFGDDWRSLKLDYLGSRGPAPRERRGR
jgi:hypothetical protein